MKVIKIQTLHPNHEKTGKNIDVAKYDTIRENMLLLLKNRELTHRELMEQLHEKVKDNFEGNAQWYGETVKLDLEARKIMERTKTKPVLYKLVKEK
jgi:hypothetical protein